MHLQSPSLEVLDREEAAVDLELQAAEILFLSFNESELMAISAAHRSLGATAPSISIASLADLRHPYSIDLLVEKTLSKCDLVVVRLLGGESYWPHGLAECRKLAEAGDIGLVVMPGCDASDPALISCSTLDGEMVSSLWDYFCAGGTENLTKALQYATCMLRDVPLDSGDWPDAPTIVPAAGYWRGDARYRSRKIGSQPSSQASSHASSDVETIGRASVVFYRSLADNGDDGFIEELADSLCRAGLEVSVIFVTSLKNTASVNFLRAAHAKAPPDVLINLTSFSAASGSPNGLRNGPRSDDAGSDASDERYKPLFAVPVLQAYVCRTSREAWLANTRGLTPREIAMNVALPEIDGRLISKIIAFRREEAADPQSGLRGKISAADPERIARLASLARGWVQLGKRSRPERKIGFVVADYPGHGGGVAYGIGLDTMASFNGILASLRQAGYSMPPDIAECGNSDLEELKSMARSELSLSLAQYKDARRQWPATARSEVDEYWGDIENDPSFDVELQLFRLPFIKLGQHILGLQPPRRKQDRHTTEARDSIDSYHDMSVPPSHSYCAFYFALAKNCDAVVHLGTHGTLEWLPGKAVALSENCFPDLLCNMPLIYPFIVNDPGEGTQAKRRTAAVIIDHLTPPLVQGGVHGSLIKLEALLEDLAQAYDLDPERAKILVSLVKEHVQQDGLDHDCQIDNRDSEVELLTKVDNFLCKTKELQIRDGLHTFGAQLQQSSREELLASMAFARRGVRRDERSLLRALEEDLDFDTDKELGTSKFEPVQITATAAQVLGLIRDEEGTISAARVSAAIRSMALELLHGDRVAKPSWVNSAEVLSNIKSVVEPRLDKCADAEMQSLVAALDAKHVEPGPSGSPSRGRIDVLPTGKNFYSFDPRSIPTPEAWARGQRNAQAIIDRYVSDEGEWPRRVALTVWGTSNLRTGGEDVAAVLELLGCEPVWDDIGRRLTSFRVRDLVELARPRVDVLVRISGFFRDAFPEQIALMDAACRVVAALDEAGEANPVRLASEAVHKQMIDSGVSHEAASEFASRRIFSSAPGTYGTGVKENFLSGRVVSRDELGRVFLDSCSHSYGAGGDVVNRPDVDSLMVAKSIFAKLAKGTDVLAFVQDAREFDILDNDEFYDSEGGFAAAVAQLGGDAKSYHGDSSSGDAVEVRDLATELAIVMRARASNPKWINSMQRHGARGAFEIARTVSALVGFAVTVDVPSHHFDLLYNSYIEDDKVRDFIVEQNSEAYREMLAKFKMAIELGLWHPRRNAIADSLDEKLPIAKTKERTE